MTAADLEWIETRFRLTLPADYRAYLLNYNGRCPEPGHLRITGRDYRGGGYDQVTGLDTVWAARECETDRDDDLVYHLQFLEELRSEGQPACAEAARWQGAPHRDWMIIGDGPPNGELEWFCLACRGEHLGAVYFAAPFLMSPEEEDYCLVAPAFAAFIGILADYDPPHLQAIRRGDLPALRVWLEAGGDPDELYRNTPLLEHAIFVQQPAIAAELLDRGAKVYDRTRNYARTSHCDALVELFASR